MQNKLIINAAKCLFYIGSILTFVIYSISFNGCTSSEEDEDVVTQRDLDSMDVYSKLQKAFTQYKSALSFNESSVDAKANESFEASLRSLNEINSSIILKNENYFWKKDFDELSVSIVEDYFTTQTEIPANSLLFEFAKRASVEYEKIEEVSPEREPLPEGSDVPLIRNSVVDGYIEFFSNTERGRSFIDKSLYRSGKFFPIMRKILKYNNMPEELIYLSVQESGLNPTIVSKAGAVGLWQFMPATGRSYGLDADGYRDDRRDFEKATDAAAHLLRDLYKTYDDWYLAFSAYNAGPGRVNKAIRNSGSRDFWSLRGHLPGETKNYTPSILALSFVLRNPEEYGFKDIEYGQQLTFDRVEIQSELTMNKVADFCETDVETIRDLNPELTSDVIPNYNTPYLLRIPHKSYDKFLANYNNASDIDKSSGFSPAFAGDETGNFGSEVTGTYYKVKNYQPENVRLIGSTSGLKKVDHKLEKKEPLPVVAAFYNVRTTDIRIWNNLNYGIIPKKNSSISVYITEEKYKLLIGKKDGNVNPADKLILDKLLAQTTTETSVKIADNNTEQKNNNKSNDKSSDKNVSNKTVDKTESESIDEQEEVSEKETEVKKTSTVNKEIVTEQQIVKSNEPVSENKSAETIVAPEESQPAPVQTYSSQPFVSGSQNEESNEEAVEESVSEPVEDETSTETQVTYYAENESETEKNPTTTNKSSVVYTVLAGDNLSKIADDHNVAVSDLKEWNNIENDKILVGQKLKIYSGEVKTSVYTVKEGDNLTLIADNYGLSVAELKEINGLNEDVIYSGQKLRVVEGKTSGKSTSNSNTAKKTYKVRKGDTLASISDKYKVSMKDLKSWNGLKGDKVMIGQVLKLYR